MDPDDRAMLTGAMVQHVLDRAGIHPLAIELHANTGYGGAPRPTSIVLRFRTETEARMFEHMLSGGGVNVSVSKGEAGLFAAMLSLS
jgi:hypothetical protein